MTTKGAEVNRKPPYPENESVPPTDEFSLTESLSGDQFSVPLDPTQYFESWLVALNSSAGSKRFLDASTDTTPLATEARRREIIFDGVLSIDGYVAGLVRSENGTLITTEAGEIDGDVVVNTAIIGGLVCGDITAANVELGSTARVIGHIQTSALSIEAGALFEGQSALLPIPGQQDIENDPRAPAEPPQPKEEKKKAFAAVAAGAG